MSDYQKMNVNKIDKNAKVKDFFYLNPTNKFMQIDGDITTRELLARIKGYTACDDCDNRFYGALFYYEDGSIGHVSPHGLLHEMLSKEKNLDARVSTFAYKVKKVSGEDSAYDYATKSINEDGSLDLFLVQIDPEDDSSFAVAGCQWYYRNYAGDGCYLANQCG